MYILPNAIKKVMIIFLKKLKEIIAYFSYILNSRLLKKKYIHVIGDSHTWSFENDKRFLSYHIGSATAYNLCASNSRTQSFQKLWKIINRVSPERDIVILVFGEIDCRIHIYNQYKKQNERHSMNLLIDKTIERYGQAMELCKEKNLRFVVYGIPPASKQKNVYNYPFYAPEEVRVCINRDFNRKLKEYCMKRNWGYIDVYSETVNQSGFMLDTYARDEVHLNEKIVPFVWDYLTENKYV